MKTTVGLRRTRVSAFHWRFAVILLLSLLSLGVLALDADQDTLPDDWETAHGRNPAKADYAVAVGANHKCVIDETSAKCWGSNTSGQLNVPVALQDKSLHPYAVSVGNTWSCACHDGGSTCWGSGYPGTPSCSVQTSGSVTVSVPTNSAVCVNTPGYYTWVFPSGITTFDCSVASGQCSLSGGFISQYAADYSSPYYCSMRGPYSVVGKSNALPVTGVAQLSQQTDVCFLADNGFSCYFRSATYNNWQQLSGSTAQLNWTYVAAGVDAGVLVDSDGDTLKRGVDPNDLLLDSDGDSVNDNVDNCAAVANADQFNTDGDAQGNVCDSDDDNDGVLDVSDAFPLNPAETVDTDTDGIGNNADTDDDSDGVADTGDNCALLGNPDQLNTDGDANGNACDTDDDNDSRLDGLDNCPVHANNDQLNTDGDTQGDVCDGDDDNDGIVDGSDNCVLVANPDQLDMNQNGVGDTCGADTDKDSLPDEWETVHGYNPAIAQYAVELGNVFQCVLTDSGDACSGTPPGGWLYRYLMADNEVGNVSVSSYCRRYTGDSQWHYHTQNRLTCTVTSSRAISCYGSYQFVFENPTGLTAAACPYSSDFTANSATLLVNTQDDIGHIAVAVNKLCALTRKGVQCWNASIAGTNSPVLTLTATGLQTHAIDPDRDGIPSDQDLLPLYSSDWDNDGVANELDAFPLNTAESVDTDMDGSGNNTDLDDDNDGIPDYIDANPINAAVNTEAQLPVNSGYRGSSIFEQSSVQ
ncbi:MAG TPA: thrombospondin type 3 repeat-containing protein [Pseudomonadales bacterium]|nr:thrombospondin type 3 repeat-containing protein [Pseudomonadales bacterium]